MICVNLNASASDPHVASGKVIHDKDKNLKEKRILSCKVAMVINAVLVQRLIHTRSAFDQRRGMLLTWPCLINAE